MLRSSTVQSNPISTCFNGLMFVGGSVMFICSIVIANQNASEPCILDDDAIALGYIDWLWYYGVLGLVMQGIFILCIGALLAVYGLPNLTRYITTCSLCIFVVLALFWLAWMIVGSILYFHDIHDSCPVGQSLYQFGLAVFIIWMIQIGLCCIRAVSRD